MEITIKTPLFFAASLLIAGCGSFPKSEGPCSEVFKKNGTTDKHPCVCDEPAKKDPAIKLCYTPTEFGLACSAFQPTLSTAFWEVRSSSGSDFVKYNEGWRANLTYVNVGRVPLAATPLGLSPRLIFTQDGAVSGGDVLALPAPIPAPWGQLNPCQTEPHSYTLAPVPIPPNGAGLRGVIVSLEGVPSGAHVSSKVNFDVR
jgi:hypothetical protein